MPSFLKKGGDGNSVRTLYGIKKNDIIYGDNGNNSEMAVMNTRKNNNANNKNHIKRTRHSNVKYERLRRPTKHHANIQNVQNVQQHANAIQPARRLTLANYKAASAKRAHAPLRALMLRNTGTRKLFRK